MPCSHYGVVWGDIIKVFCMDEPKLGPREKTQLDCRINRAEELLRRREDNLHMLCHCHISCGHFRSGYDKERGQYPSPEQSHASAEVTAWTLRGAWTCQIDGCYLEQMTSWGQEGETETERRGGGELSVQWDKLSQRGGLSPERWWCYHDVKRVKSIFTTLRNSGSTIVTECYSHRRSLGKNIFK